MFPLPMLATIPVDLESMDSRHAVPYHLAFMKNTILRAFNNIYTRARELRRGDARLEAFLEYVAGLCDVLVLQIRADERLFGSPVIIDVALEKLLNEGCIQDMRKVMQGAERLKKLAQKYAKVGVACTTSSTLAAAEAEQLLGDYDGREIVAHLSFSEEYAARSWAQLHSLDLGRLEEVCSDVEMRRGLRQIIDSFVRQSDVAFLVPFIHSHHDKETSHHWPTVSPEGRLTLPCLAKMYAKSWELAPFDVSTGIRRERRGTKTKF
ncbi:hypothetical protein EI94DRAFT_1707107 [Lactarius quietus]|nr:hypothetical protein EI94DRAFT_1707107 [Lactarius quietus]